MATAKTSPEFVRITNLTDAVIDLPPVPASKANPKGWPAFQLIPGGNNVPLRYLTDLRTFETKDAFGNVVRPGEAHLAKLAAPQTFWHHLQFPNGKIKIDEDPKATLRRKGKEAPKDLRTISVDAALDEVARSRDLDQLNAWTETETRSDVLEALAERIAKLS